MYPEVQRTHAAALTVLRLVLAMSQSSGITRHCQELDVMEMNVGGENAVN